MTSLPPTPVIERDVCPYEMCVLGPMIATTRVPVYVAEGSPRGVSFYLKAGERFVAVSGDVYVEKPGVVTVTKPFRSFKPGEQVFVLSYRGEGVYDYWNGKVVRDDPLTLGDEYDTRVWYETSVVGFRRSTPAFTWWIHIKTAAGRTGWVACENTAPAGFGFSTGIEPVRGR